MYFQTGQVIFVPEWPKGEFVSILALFYVWTKSLICKDAANRDSTVQNQVRRNSSSLSAFRTMFHPVRTPTVPAPSVQTTYHTVRTQTVQHHPSGRRPPSVRTPTQYRETSVSDCFRPDVSAARPDATQFSNDSLILSKFQEREDQSTVRTMWYTVRTRISIRQESQFKFDHPDV
jgi:hypothetical protein